MNTYDTPHEERYEVTQRLSSPGMFSSIYKGTQRIDGQEDRQPVIIKVFNKGYELNFIEDEIRAFHDLRSPFVNGELDFGEMLIEGEERKVLILEPAENNLNFFGNKLTVEQIKEVFRQLIKGLEFIHNHNYVHGDIKADNILIRHHKDDIPEAFYGDLGMAEKRSKSSEAKFQEKVAIDKVNLLYTLLNLLLYKTTRDPLVNANYIMERLKNHNPSSNLPPEVKQLVYFVYKILATNDWNPSYNDINEALDNF